MLLVCRSSFNGDWSAAEKLHVTHFTLVSFLERRSLNELNAFSELAPDSYADKCAGEISSIEDPV